MNTAVYDDVVARLYALGYTVTASADAPDLALKYNIDSAERSIKMQINRSEIPDGLHNVWVDMAAGLYLQALKSTGRLDDIFDFSAPTKSISEGDVSVTFAGASDGVLTPEARFDKLIDSMINPPPSAFAHFRKMRW